MPSPAEGPVKPSVKLPYSAVPEHDHDDHAPIAIALAPVQSDISITSATTKALAASDALEPEVAPTHWSDMFKLPPLNAEERHRMKLAPDGSPLYEAHQGANRQYMRDIILGVNDGLISVFLLLIGLAGGGVGSREILLAGITSALAGAISMALGEYLATKSQAEVYAGDIELEKRHFKYFRASEIHQLRTIFEHDLHLEGELLEQVVAKIGADDDALLKVMMAFEFGLNEADQRSPVKAMMMCGCLFITGSSLSWLPFCFTEDVHFAITIASVLCGFGMFIVGAYKTVATRGNWVYSGLENFCVGAIGAGVSYALGVLYDVLRDRD